MAEYFGSEGWLLVDNTVDSVMYRRDDIQISAATDGVRVFGAGGEGALMGVIIIIEVIMKLP